MGEIGVLVTFRRGEVAAVSMLFFFFFFFYMFAQDGE
jgi:hypothetical protein